MGTTAAITFRAQGRVYFKLQAQYDGYPEGVGVDLAKILVGGTMVRGMGSTQNLGKVFNGPGCLAATVIAILKDKPGDYYLLPADSNPEENYNYTIEVEGGSVQMSCISGFSLSGGKLLFEGSPEDFLEEFQTKKP